MYDTTVRLHEALKYFSIVNLHKQFVVNNNYVLIVDLNLFLISLFFVLYIL